MLARIGFAVGGFVLLMFAMGRVESLFAHRGFAGSTAWAEDWFTSPDDADVDTQPATVPDVSGTYTGTVNDDRDGSGSAGATINQNRKGLTGSWSFFFHGGTLKGKVDSNGNLHIRLKAGGRCGANFKGTFQNGNEITGSYQVTGCRKGNGDHGTLDILK